MHILDLIMYVVLSIIYWVGLPDDYKYDLGVILSFIVFVVFTVIYSIVFIFFLNWIDIYHHIQHVTLPSITL